MQIQNFLITKWMDDLSKTSVGWIFFSLPWLIFFSFYQQQLFCLIFSVEYAKLLKPKQN